MKILVIGSKGFIGSHCVNYFSKQYEVWGCDVVTDYNTINYFLVDSTNADYSEIFNQIKFDICINCSGAASVPDSIKNPQRDFILNTYNVFKQLDAIRKHSKNCKYINLSSAAVYGNPKSLPIGEEQGLKPISPYGNHKKMAEDICEEFYNEFGILSCNLRIFSAYGPGLKKQLFWDLFRKFKSNHEIVLYGTGKESRDFIYISDLIQAIECVIQKSNFNAEIVNVANGEEITIEKMVNLFYAHLDSTTSYSFGGESRAGDPNNWKADITKLGKFGYSPRIDIEQGISNYILWLKENK
ncbi:MAG: SDR family oxidoreductase [Flavobacteriales bacterium]|nr:SDR family oxidoreductase [Flavobacteriales bacterium]